MFHRLSKLTRAIYCVIRGHHYVPSYVHHWSKTAWFLPRENETMTYECEHCGEKRSVSREGHAAFLKKHCPTWGGRGSDSQGYRNEE
jgi:hypothetical protein